MSGEGAIDLVGTVVGGEDGRGAAGVPPERSEGGPADPAAPPDGNTGVKTAGEIMTGVHWLALTAWAGEEFVTSLASACMGVRKSAFERMPYGGHGYRICLLGPLGVKIYAGPIDGGDHVHLVLPGGACEVLGSDGLLDLADGFARKGIRTHATRIDLALDGGGYTPEEVRSAFLAGEVRSYTRRDTHGWQSSPQGTTFSMGSRSSERYARVYDRRGPTRFELECKRDRAVAIWAILSTSALSSWPEQIRGHIRDFCDFNAEWWSALMGGAARAMLRLGSVVLATAESARAWLRRQAAPWLAALVQLDGGSLEFVSELLSSGKHRYGKGQQLALQGVLSRPVLSGAG